jgi:hypothetical protein
MRKTIGKAAIFMMIRGSSSWHVFLIFYVWQYEAIYVAPPPPKAENSWHREIRIFYARYSEF